MENTEKQLEEKFEQLIGQQEEKDRGHIDYRLLITAAMGLFVVFVMCWGVYHMIQDMDGQQGTQQITQGQTEVNESSAGQVLAVDALVDALLNQVQFDTELAKIDDSVAEGMVTTEPGTQLQVYMGNGSFADEIVIMSAKNEKAAKKNQENAKKHLEEMQQMFQDYIPKEAKKIEGAVRVRCGSYVIVCVTSDTDTAKKVINKEIKK